MKNLSLVLLCMFAISCGSIGTRVNEALTSTKELALDIKKTSATLREDTLPALKSSAKSTAEATDQIRATTLELQRVMVNLEPKLVEIKTAVVGTLTEIEGLASDARDLKGQVEVEINKASGLSQKLSTHGNTLSVLMYVGVALGGVLLLLFVVVLHHKLTAPKRHTKQLEHMLGNGGAQKIMKALKPELDAEFVEKSD